MDSLELRRPAVLDQSLGKLVRRAEQAMVRAKGAAVKPVGLTLAQFVTLAELDQQEGVTAASLARGCEVSPQAMMILLKSMEQQGLITRRVHPRHPNVLELHITDVGREALAGARELMAPFDRVIGESFSERELMTLRVLLGRFIDAMDESAPAFAD